MEAEGRVVRVSGLPVDMPENRLIDKVYIHFLRKRNGGGEISSVTISKSTPGMAFIMFEESEVALRLAKKGKVLFHMNNKSYEVRVGLQYEEVDPDKVILQMSVNVDYSKLPDGKRTIWSLHQSFPQVHLTFNDKNTLCTLKGCYTEVQSLSSLVLASLESQKQHSSKREDQEFPLNNADDILTGANEAVGVTKNAPLSKEPDLEMESEVWKTNSSQSSSYIHQVSPESFIKDKLAVEPEAETPEDFSLVVDSDIFCYLHKYCTREYQGILRRHRVEIVDVTCQDITILYINPKKSLSGQGISSIKKAQEDLAHLYQEKESQLRKENISKSSIPEKGLEPALESLKQRLPKLMINEDEGNVFLVGSKSDVSEAKQFIMDVKEIRTDKDTRSGDLFAPFQSSSMFSHQEGLKSSEQLDVYGAHGHTTRFQGLDVLLKPRRDHQNANEEEIHNSKPKQVELKPCDDHTPLDMSSTRRNSDTLQERHLQADEKKMSAVGWYNRDTDPLFLPSKSSGFSTLDLGNKPLDNTDLHLEETKHTCHEDPAINGLEKQLKQQRVHKVKRTDSGRELKMAANFSKEMSSGLTESAYSLYDVKKAGDHKSAPKTEEDVSVNEQKLPANKQLQSLPFIKPSMNSNLKASFLPGSMGAKCCGLSKMDIQVLRVEPKKPGQFPANSTEKKSTVMPAFSTEAQSSSLSHMDLCGDVGRIPTMPLGSARRRSNSFSGRGKTGQDKQTDVSLLVGQNERTRTKVITMYVIVSQKLWHYLKSVYISEIDNLTSDLQVKERFDEDFKKFTLCIRGADAQKVKECHRGVQNLFDTVKMDFDTRTLPLSMLGVTDCKDKMLLKFCTAASLKKVKIEVMSDAVVILGAKSVCEEVEETMMDFFQTVDDGAKAKMENGKPPEPSTLEVSTDLITNESYSLADQPATASEKAQQISKKDSPKTSDQSNTYVLDIDPRLLEDQSSDTSREALKGDKQKHGIHGEIWSNMETDERTQLLDKKGHTPKVHPGADGAVNKGSEKMDNFINSGREDQTHSKGDGHHGTSPNLQKSADMESTSPISRTFTEQVHPCSSDLPSHMSGHQSLPLSCMCGGQGRSVKQTACGMNLCSECEKEAHDNCKLCSSEDNRGTWGIKGTMSVSELTITIPGFIRDTTLRIVYDIPDGIQGEGHPCPGAPFKGNTFEAFLPHNVETRRLLPLLEKAFHKGITFSVKVASTGKEDVGFLVWGSIPHKTRIEGGASKNAYPDSTYIKRLVMALRTAGLGE